MFPCEPKNCYGCSACASLCTHKAIVMKEDEYGFIKPFVNEEICNNCGLCSKKCPANNQDSIKNVSVKYVYATRASNKDIVKTSSSGGVFSLLAENIIINNNGYVCGAIQSNFDVFHKVSNKFSDILSMKGSKYVQSDLKNVFNEIKILVKEHPVLFVGTPCQVAGLRQVIGKKNDKNLITVDLICHGVPSRKIFRQYFAELRRKYPTANSFSFRDKKYGWRSSHLLSLFDDDNNRIFTTSGQFNEYIRGFLQNCYNRESCSTCPFACLSRVGDITLGDFWHINELDEKFDKKLEGTSALLINTVKGKILFDNIKSKLEKIKVFDINDIYIYIYQAQLRGPAPKHKERELFLNKIKEQSEQFNESFISFLNKNLFHVGILNFHFANNYGAVLVTFSMLEILKNLGYKPEVINYLPVNVNRKAPFEKFRKNYLNPMSRTIVNREDLIKMSPWWKKIIVGSDQVFRMFNTGIYMLDWVKGNRTLISYAASFGQDYYCGSIDENKASVLLKRFDAVSVREKSGNKICKNLGVNSIQVIDPTFLIKPEQYELIINDFTSSHKIDIKDEYILKIFLSKNNNNNFEKNIKLNNKIKSFTKITGNEIILDGIYSENLDFRDVGEWLFLIKNAKYIVTDSFHGTVFSIIFKKQFLSIVNFNGQDRIKSLLSMLEIDEDRILTSVDKIFMPNKILKDIDYINVDEKINLYKDKSISFIKNALEIIPNKKNEIIQI